MSKQQENCLMKPMLEDTDVMTDEEFKRDCSFCGIDFDREIEKFNVGIGDHYQQANYSNVRRAGMTYKGGPVNK